VGIFHVICDFVNYPLLMGGGSCFNDAWSPQVWIRVVPTLQFYRVMD